MLVHTCIACLLGHAATQSLQGAVTTMASHQVLISPDMTQFLRDVTNFLVKSTMLLPKPQLLGLQGLSVNPAATVDALWSTAGPSGFVCQPCCCCGRPVWAALCFSKHLPVHRFVRLCAHGPTGPALYTCSDHSVPPLLLQALLLHTRPRST